jgi:hypothetical protein
MNHFWTVLEEAWLQEWMEVDLEGDTERMERVSEYSYLTIVETHGLSDFHQIAELVSQPQSQAALTRRRKWEANERSTCR